MNRTFKSIVISTWILLIMGRKGFFFKDKLSLIHTVSRPLWKAIEKKYCQNESSLIKSLSFTA
jgi:hypothetical protein